MATNPTSERNGAEQEATSNGTGLAATNGARAENGGDDAAGDGAGGAGAGAGSSADAVSGPHPPPATADHRPITTAKDISLKDFLNKMDDYAPIVGNPPVLDHFVVLIC